MTDGRLWVLAFVASLLAFSGSAEKVEAQAGGHVGLAVPFATFSKHTTTIADDAVLLAPIGVGFKLTDAWKVDLETVVITHLHPTGSTGLIVDPGLIYNWGPVATGLRVAFKIGQPANVGLIPLINVPLVHMSKATWFAEAAFPTFYTEHTVSLTTVLHTGVGF